MKIFLQGPSSIGKSTLLLRCLKNYHKRFGGFVTQRMVEGGETRAFCLTPAAKASEPTIPYRTDAKNIFLFRSLSGWVRNDIVFEDAVRALKQDIERNHLLVLDEIGGVELSLPVFREMLFKLILSDRPLLGVVKSLGNRTALAENVVIESDQFRWYSILLENIRKHSDGMLLTLNRENRGEVEEIVMDFLNNL